jgi:hypothetical protein
VNGVVVAVDVVVAHIVFVDVFDRYDLVGAARDERHF